MDEDELIEITPAMIEAGVYELREKQYGEPLDDIVRDVYLAMVIEQRAANAPPR